MKHGIEEAHFRFAVRADDATTQDLHAQLRVVAHGAPATPPLLHVAGEHAAAVDVRWNPLPCAEAGGDLVLDLTIRASALPVFKDDDAFSWQLSPEGQPDAPAIHITLRRTGCRLSTALLSSADGDGGLFGETVANVLWYAWNRFAELVALKEFVTGFSGNSVLVFRPRLRRPRTEEAVLVGAPPIDATSDVWGTPLLVKTGPKRKLDKEWQRYELFLADRLHPFMARLDHRIETQALDSRLADERRISVIGPFLGGDSLQTEPLESFVRNATDASQVEQGLGMAFRVTASLYEGGQTVPLRRWAAVFTSSEPGQTLFGKLELADKAARHRFIAPLMWDVSFVKHEHLEGHLLGDKSNGGRGLLKRLADIPVRFSVTHGDLHPRNVLLDEHNAWLLDWGETGIAPTLHDFAKLELYTRLWCLNLHPTDESMDLHATRFERLMLDHFTGVEGSFEPMRRMAAGMGADSDELVRVAHAIGAIRRQSLEYSQGYPDRRDYLAVLFLNVLRVLNYAQAGSEDVCALRHILSLYWLLEETLSGIVGMKPFARRQVPAHPRQLLTADWIRPPRAPERIRYWLKRDEGARALDVVAATRGVLQNSQHHLDVFDHILMTVAGVEDLLADPIRAMADPTACFHRTLADLAAQGITLPAPAAGRVDEGDQAVPVWLVEAARERAPMLRDALGAEQQCVLKWAAMLHDVGKAGTRGRVIVPGNDGLRRVQSPGHEAFGVSLSRKLLQTVFAEEDAKANDRGHGFRQVERLVTGHHLHHTLCERMLAHGELIADARAHLGHDTLSPCLRKIVWEYIRPDAPDREDFLLLILHGFADAMATRGVDTKVRPTAMAAADLLMLCIYVDADAIARRDALEARCREMRKGLAHELGVEGARVGVLHDYLLGCYLEAATAADGSDEAITPTLLKAWAQAFLARSGGENR